MRKLIKRLGVLLLSLIMVLNTFTLMPKARQIGDDGVDGLFKDEAIELEFGEKYGIDLVYDSLYGTLRTKTDGSFGMIYNNFTVETEGVLTINYKLIPEELPEASDEAEGYLRVRALIYQYDEGAKQDDIDLRHGEKIDNRLCREDRFSFTEKVAVTPGKKSVDFIVEYLKDYFKSNCRIEYSIDFEPTNGKYEYEDNSKPLKETELVCGETCTAFSDVEYEDVFEFSVKKGNKYRIDIPEFKEMWENIRYTADGEEQGINVRVYAYEDWYITDYEENAYLGELESLIQKGYYEFEARQSSEFMYLWIVFPPDYKQYREPEYHQYQYTVKLTEIDSNDGKESTTETPSTGTTDGETPTTESPNIGDDTVIQPISSDINVSYRTHIQTYGWEGNKNNIDTWKYNGMMSGTSGKSKRLEGINIVVNPADSAKDVDLGIQYTTHCQSYGWLPWSANGDMNGTEGEAKRLEAIKIQLTGVDAKNYDVYYRVHAQTYGWLNWAKNGEPSGTAGYAKRLEGIQIIVVKKGEAFDKNLGGIVSKQTKAYIAKEGLSPIVNANPTNNSNPVVPGADTPNVMYRTHVQKYGWQAWKYNGAMSGTSGEAKRLEGIEINLTNAPYDGDIVYTTHVQKYGWQGDVNKTSTWKKNGEMSGTSGEAKRLEAICINLTGEMSEYYDIYYRVHAQTFGWLGWAKNGEESGTAGYAKRLEGIQIVLVPKGGAAPSINYGGITSKDARPYISK